MYCVIQEIETKKPNKYGAYKKLEAYIGLSSNGRDKYSYRHTGDRFERPIKKAYKISLHESYREHSKVKKKQYSIGTVGYYDFNGWGLYDYCGGKIKALAEQINIPEDNIFDLIYEKYNNLEDKIQQEFQQSEEYRTDKKHTEIIQKYIRDKAEFADKYHVSDSEYDYCYNVFGDEVNKAYISQIIKNAKAYEEKQKSSYSNSDSSNYSDYDYSSYFKINNSTYSEDEKAKLKKFYKLLAVKFHPDSNRDIDTTEEMKLLNKIKGQWDI